MRTWKQRIITAGLVVTMVLGILPTVVLAAGTVYPYSNLTFGGEGSFTDHEGMGIWANFNINNYSGNPDDYHLLFWIADVNGNPISSGSPLADSIDGSGQCSAYLSPWWNSAWENSFVVDEIGILITDEKGYFGGLADYSSNYQFEKLGFDWTFQQTFVNTPVQLSQSGDIYTDEFGMKCLDFEVSNIALENDATYGLSSLETEDNGEQYIDPYFSGSVENDTLTFRDFILDDGSWFYGLGDNSVATDALRITKFTTTGNSTNGFTTTLTHYPVGVPSSMTISLDYETLILGVTAEQTLVPTVTFAEGSVIYSWSSDKPDIASVDENGKITAKAVGEAIITVSASDGTQNAVTACYVEVREPDEINLADAADFIATNGTLLYEPRIDSQDYALYTCDKVLFDAETGFTTESGVTAYYLLDEDGHLVTAPDVLIKAGFLQEMNGAKGFKNSTAYAENFETSQYMKEQNTLKEIYNEYGSYTGSLGAIINNYEMYHTLSNLATTIDAIIDLMENPTILGLLEFNRDMNDMENEISTVEYVYTYASQGVLELSKRIGFGDGISTNKGEITRIREHLSDDFPYLTDYGDAVAIEEYKLLEAENQTLHPLALKYLQHKDSWDWKIYPLIFLDLEGEYRQHKENLESWMGTWDPLRGDIQEKMWFTKAAGPKGKALLTLDRSKITDPDFSKALETIDDLQDAFNQKIYPTESLNTLNNMELTRTIADVYPAFDQIVAVHCPVNVTVYNASEKIIGQISKGVIDEAYPYDENNPLVLFTDGESKTLIFPRDKNYKLEIKAYDNGIMEYNQWHTDENGTVVSETNVQNIVLTKEDTYQANPTSVSTDTAYALLFEKTESGVAATPSNVTIAVSSDGNGQTVGGGDFLNGDQVTVQAIPNDGLVFEGWYEDGSKVTDAAVSYTFVATENRALKAKFVPYTTDITYTAIQIGGTSGTEDSSSIDITFNTLVESLLLQDITLSGDTGAVITGLMDVDGTTWRLLLSEIKKEGSAQLSIANYGVYNFTTGTLPVELYQDTTAPSSSSGGVSSFTSRVASTEHGDVKLSKKNSAVTITATPDEGYEVDKVTVTDSTGGEVPLTKNPDGTYSYKQPGANVTVIVTFVKMIAFADVATDAYYYDAVKWAVANDITAGTSATTFSPHMTCTRAQAVTFLYRAAGSPEVTGDCMFTDVNADAYYYDAVLWAVSKGITAGTSATTFSPDEVCSRSQIVTFLYREAGEPEITGDCLFTDVNADAYYYDAVLWAVREGITAGTSATSFSPNNDCTRGQIVTFLYRNRGE